MSSSEIFAPLVVPTFATYKRFGLVHVRYRELEGNLRGRAWEAPLVVPTFATDKRFGLVHVRYRELEGNLTGRTWGAPRTVILTIHAILSVSSTPSSNLIMTTLRLPCVGLEPNYDTIHRQFRALLYEMRGSPKVDFKN
jgi:hypothetical protein